jgi:hypothetical protein
VRLVCAALVAAFLPFAVAAEPLKEGADWRNCSKDDQCVMIDGLCDKTAVNWQAKAKAQVFYAQERMHVKCAIPFWRVGEKMPRCRLGSCETIVKQAANAEQK